MDGSKNITILAPHIDDEAIGVGGSIAKHVALGNSVSVIYFCSGNNLEEISTREAEAKNACDFLGVSKYDFLRQNIQSLSSDFERKLVNLIRENDTDFLYAPHPDDGDIEHVIVSKIASRMQWMASGQYLENRTETKKIRGLFLYEVHRPIQVVQYFEDISDYIKKKEEVISLYVSQTKNVDYAKGIIGLNTYRGIFSEKANAAEAFGLSGFENFFDKSR